MKQTHFILVVFLLFNCTDNNIAPTPPDQDAASARKDFYTFISKGEKPYSLNLKKANIYYVFNGDYSAGPSFPIGNIKVIVITDGVPNGQVPVTYLDTPEDYKGETYIIIIGLFSKYDDVVIPGTFKPLPEYIYEYPNTVGFLGKENSYVVYSYDYKKLVSDPAKYGDNNCPTQTHIEYLAKEASDLKFKANSFANGEAVTITFNADMEMSFCTSDIPAYNGILGKGNFNASGIINADYLKSTATN